VAVLIDSGVVIGFLDRADTPHEASAQRITELVGNGEPLLASVITYAEVLVGVRRGHHDRAAADGFFEVTQLVDITASVAERAAALRAGSSLKLPDALVAACAESAQAGLLTTDRDLAGAMSGELDVEVLGA